MRIDAYSAVSSLYAANSRQVSRKKTVSKEAGDSYEISQTARDYGVAKEAVNKASDVREDKVAEIKAMMSAGRYNVSTEAIADRMLQGIDTITF